MLQPHDQAPQALKDLSLTSQYQTLKDPLRCSLFTLCGLSSIGSTNFELWYLLYSGQMVILLWLILVYSASSVQKSSQGTSSNECSLGFNTMPFSIKVFMKFHSVKRYRCNRELHLTKNLFFVLSMQAVVGCSFLF